ncbi:MAG: ribosome maturation factor RimP [Phenylobacterium sp.]|uniref:ribosome maturation factor RimP n=1 Tax=Phenylobacterium sp. TaxID=1871053 RepID=UPI0025D43B43|nr:ribosome maturation factor RimP [Phenylobacterium sp.]MCA3723940.1 ribosome maturation factor RimP [Phenylobacterium sp.]MCA6256270.1 ribosome maturation factor RimP [Phenylobacterium sp.]
MTSASGGLRPGRFFVGPKGRPDRARRDRMRSRTAEDARLLELLDPVAEAAGYEIVRLRLMGGDHARRLQIMAETPEGEMNVEDCARLSRALSEVLDAADPLSGEYTLEVSTPGVDRPLTRLKDFETFGGHEARLELDRMAEGRKRFRGELAGVEGDQVAINLEGEAETALVPFAWITEAKLILTDRLMERGAQERARRLAGGSPSDSDQEDLP